MSQELRSVRSVQYFLAWSSRAGVTHDQGPTSRNYNGRYQPRVDVRAERSLPLVLGSRLLSNRI